MELRGYQAEIAEKAITILEKEGIVYLAMEMRTGKTFTSLKIAEVIGAKKVLFLTKKKVIETIKKEAERAGLLERFELEVTNYESAHKVKARDYDVVILDEAHEMGNFPKPNKKQKDVRKICTEIKPAPKFILLSGTPNPESYSQLYHEFWVTGKGPFTRYKNFYYWVRDYVNVYQWTLHGRTVYEYKYAKDEKVKHDTAHLMITKSQEEAGFENHEIEEEIMRVPMPTTIDLMVTAIKKKGVWRGGREYQIICDTAMSQMGKIHQLCSGTVIMENDKREVVSDFKASAIAERFKGKKIAIFYVYTTEADAIRRHFSNVVEDPIRFEQEADAVFISQIKAGAMGISLASAEYLVFYNIDYSAKLYFQARARLGSMDRKEKQKIVWVFSENGIEDRIYGMVSKKKDFTLDYFRRVLDGVGVTKKMPEAPGGLRVVWA